MPYFFVPWVLNTLYIFLYALSFIKRAVALIMFGGDIYLVTWVLPYHSVGQCSLGAKLGKLAGVVAAVYGVAMVAG